MTRCSSLLLFVFIYLFIYLQARQKISICDFATYKWCKMEMVEEID